MLQVKVDATAEEARRRARRRAPQRGAAVPPRRRRRHDRAARLDRRLGRAGRGEALPAARERQAPGRRAPRHQAEGAARRAARRASRSRSRTPTPRAPRPPTRRRSSTSSPRSRRARATRPRARCRPRTPRSARRSRSTTQAEADARRPSRSASPSSLQSAGDGPALGDGTFIRPVPGPITSGFGYRTDPDHRRHRLPLRPRLRRPVRHADQGGRHRRDPHRRLQQRWLRQHDADQPRQRVVDAVRPPVVDHRVGRASR